MHIPPRPVIRNLEPITRNVGAGAGRQGHAGPGEEWVALRGRRRGERLSWHCSAGGRGHGSKRHSERTLPQHLAVHTAWFPLGGVSALGDARYKHTMAAEGQIPQWPIDRRRRSCTHVGGRTLIRAGTGEGDKFMAALVHHEAADCGEKERGDESRPLITASSSPGSARTPSRERHAAAAAERGQISARQIITAITQADSGTRRSHKG